MKNQPLYILIVENGVKLPFSDELTVVQQWISQNLPFTATFEKLTANVPISYETVFWNGMKSYSVAYSTRKAISSLVPYNDYNIIIHVHKPEEINGVNFFSGQTFQDQRYAGAVLIDLCIESTWDEGDTLQNVTHELMHAMWTMLKWSNIIPASQYFLYDTMDSYFKDDQVWAPDGNRAQNLARLAPYFQILAKQMQDPFLKRLLQQVIDLATKLLPWVKRSQSL